ncbi:MAG: hypothetical protein HY728_07165 [Candidatus Rokubacteria bacterium]|nr:hypothetical protein [Candidatus Rokubacteria bacterium]MBI4593980.1 hypothetical protein [Candidatus Rokubacteria bacterium]
MNLFRSEEHARRWSGFMAGSDVGILSLDQAMAIMSTPRHRDRFTGRYVSSFPGYAAPFFARIREVTGGDPYWAPAA